MCTRIREVSKEMNMNKQQFSKLIGISPQYLGTVEAGIHGLSLDSLINLCEATKTSADYILFGRKSISLKNLQIIFSGLDEDDISKAFELLENAAVTIRRIARRYE